MADFNAVAKEVFQVLRSFDYTVQLYDENGMQVTEPEKARRLMCHPKNLMVSLLDDDDNSRITLSIGKSTHINDVMGLNQKLRILATKYNMVSRTQQYGKAIDPKQFAELASLTEQKDNQMQVCEGMYGTSRSSYLRLENARMIVRHKSRIDDSQIGARGRCVESIFVENALGERDLMPTTNLAAARAMTQHVNQGGGFGDMLGEQIKGMAIDYGHLQTGAQAALTEAVALREACRCKMDKLRECFQRLGKASTYAEEAANLESQREILNETDEPITDARIDEVRQLLQGEHDKEIYECCCKALDEMQVNERQEAQVQVLGHGVSLSAWDAFRNGTLELHGEPQFADISFPSVMGEIAYRLGEVAKVTADDSMANLLSAISDRMTDEHDRRVRDKYRIIAVHALRAVDAMPSRLASKNPTVQEHVSWFQRFDPARVLSEAWSPMDPSFSTAPSEQAGDMALQGFDGDEFVASPEMQDILSGRNPLDPEENEVARDEIKQALQSYLAHYVERHDPNYTYDAFEDTHGMADAVYDAAVDTLQRHGYVVAEANLAEDTAIGNEELTIEDVLLPKRDQGADLQGDVTTADVVTPAHPDQHEKPDAAHISRLMTLAGQRSVY